MAPLSFKIRITRWNPFAWPKTQMVFSAAAGPAAWDQMGFSRGFFEKLLISGGLVGSCVLRILPPMRACASTTTHLIPFSRSSRAAVMPAGPAPMTTTPTFIFFTCNETKETESLPGFEHPKTLGPGLPQARKLGSSSSSGNRKDIGILKSDERPLTADDDSKEGTR